MEMSERLIGVVDHWYGHLKVAGITVTDGSLAVGNRIHIVGHTTDLTETIGSMQIDHVTVDAASAGDQVGVVVTDRVRVGDDVYLMEG
jgi:putative protease